VFDHIAQPPDPAPRVLMSYAVNSEFATAKLTRELAVLAQSMLSSFGRVGVVPIVTDAASAPAAGELLGGCDGVVILGGADLDPSHYGQPCGSDTMYGVDTNADAFEISLARGSVVAGIPLLGICRGMQVMNIALGGTLVQDLGAGTIHRLDDGPSKMANHPVRIVEGTKLGEVYGESALTIRSEHHQAVDVLGTGLIVAATAPDGVIEAVELEDQWAVGIQWHPEDRSAPIELLDPLVAAFARAAATRAATCRPTSIPDSQPAH
jgi:putative glutamine amidotransferase